MDGHERKATAQHFHSRIEIVKKEDWRVRWKGVGKDQKRILCFFRSSAFAAIWRCWGHVFFFGLWLPFLKSPVDNWLLFLHWVDSSGQVFSIFFNPELPLCVSEALGKTVPRGRFAWEIISFTMPLGKVMDVLWKCSKSLRLFTFHTTKHVQTCLDCLQEEVFVASSNWRNCRFRCCLLSALLPVWMIRFPEPWLLCSSLIIDSASRMWQTLRQ